MSSAIPNQSAGASGACAEVDSPAQLAYEWARMLGPARIYFIVFGLLTIAGGIMGYVSKGSVPSIIAGSVSGLALIAAAFLLPNNAVAGLVMGGLVSLLLAGRFVPAFIKTGGIMPSGMMSVLSVIGIIIAIVAWMKK